MDASGVATTSEACVVDSPEEDKPSGGAGMGGMGSTTYYNLTSDCTLLVSWLTLIHSSSGAENGHIGLLTLVNVPLPTSSLFLTVYSVFFIQEGAYVTAARLVYSCCMSFLLAPDLGYSLGN